MVEQYGIIVSVHLIQTSIKDFNKVNLDNIMLLDCCNNVIKAVYLTQNLVQHSFDDFFDTHGPCNSEDFPTHVSTSSLNPVIYGMPV